MKTNQPQWGDWVKAINPKNFSAGFSHAIAKHPFPRITPATPASLLALYHQEVEMLKKGNHPAAPKSDVVWCLSGRVSVLGSKDTTGQKREVDPTEDLDRLLLSIEIANRDNVGIVFNATDKANEDLQALLDICKNAPSLDQFQQDNAAIYDYLSLHYNDTKITDILTILHKAEPKITILTEGIKNTVDQAASFNRHLEDHPEIKNVHVVSNGYHLPRVARVLGKDSPCAKNPDGSSNALGNISIHLSGIDMAFQKPGIELDLGNDPSQPNEPNALWYYIRNQKVAPGISSNMSVGAEPERYSKLCNDFMSRWRFLPVITGRSC